MNEKKIFEYVQGGRKFVVEVGELAKQANAAVLVRFGDTAVLSVAVMSKEAADQDFFPLTVIFQEKLYAGGKIPGGFLRREGRPSEHETLSARLIDRPIRPLFAEGFRNDVQVINTVLSADPDNSSQMAAMLGASLALSISDIPFAGPIAGVTVGHVDNEFVLNPTVDQVEKSDLHLIVAGTDKAINMVEAGAKELPEEVLLQAMMFAHEEVKHLVEFQKTIREQVGREKTTVELRVLPVDLESLIEEMAAKDLKAAVVIKEKLERYNKIDEITSRVIDNLSALLKDDEAIELKIKLARNKLEAIVAGEVRRLITAEKLRPDGRCPDEIRPLSSAVDVLVRPHGSALFTRGQTQALSAVTLGALGEYQIIDGLGVEEGKRFMFHYNFPPYSVGETGRYTSPGRREIGHGALGEKALLRVLPSEDEFPYTIRVVSEILESNGSSSQASICAGTMALMAAGVPIKSPIAGIAMGLVSEGSDYTILTDIQGMEDHYGDMDFKVAGSASGITALQMDIKVAGINEEILRKALAQARVARLRVLEHMLTTIPNYRPEVSQYAPKVICFYIDPLKIREVIGTGGKIITDIINQCNDVKIDIEQDGRVTIMHTDKVWAEKAAKIIEDIIKVAEVGQFYQGKVVRIEKFGAFVELWQNTEGLVHISKMASEKVAKVEDVLHIGDEIMVKVIGIDEKGRIDLATKDYVDNPRKPSPPRGKRPPQRGSFRKPE